MRAFSHARSLWLRRMAVVCLLVAGAAGFAAVQRSASSVRVAEAATASAADRPAERDPTTDQEAADPPAADPPAPGWRMVREPFTATGDAPVRVLPASAQATGAPPVLTMLHGMGSSTANTCARIAGATSAGFVVTCPTGNVDYGNGTADWSGEGEDKARHIDAALAAGLAPLSLTPSAERGDILMGFSRGAFVARDVAYARAGKWRGLVLVGAALTPDAKLLRENGIRRVVLASGDFDGAKRTMVAARAKLCAAGMPARFVSLGPVWHDLPADSMQRLAEAIAWARGEGDDDCGSATPLPLHDVRGSGG